MTYTPNTSLRGTSRGDPGKIAAWAIGKGAKRPTFLRWYLSELYRLCALAGLDADVLAGQSHLETGGWTSEAWDHGNPAGLGVTNDSERDDYTIVDGITAARLHATHIALYVFGESIPDALAPYRTLDYRWDAAVRAGYAGVASTLGDLTNRWAVDDRYGEKIADRMNQMAAAGLLDGPASEPEEEDEPMATKPYILLVAGHRSYGDRGSPTERNLTDNLAVAYLAAFRDAGYDCDWFQQIDADNDPTMTSGGLDAVALGCARVLARRDDELSIMLDLHFNTSRSAVHAIVPHNRRQDGRGALSTAYVQGRNSDDIAPNNPLDVTMAGAIAREIVASVPGMTLWRARDSGVPGVMLESESGVGGDGFRLAMMAATAPSRMKAVRITIEHGGTNDASKPDFFNQCARASLRAVTATMAARNAGGDGTGGPEPEPEEPEPEEPTVPALVSFLFGAVGDYQFDPTGPVSTLWLARATETDRWPRLVDVLINGSVKHFVFSDGSVIVGEGRTATWLDDIAA